MNVESAPWQDVAARLRPFIARRVAPTEIDDVMQDVFVRMQRGLPALRDEERFTSWLFQIARNSVADHMRVRARPMFVAQLATPYREAVTLVELEGLTTREAAEMVGISISGMKSRVQRGRERLRALFDACCEIAIDARGKVTDYAPRAASCPRCK